MVDERNVSEGYKVTEVGIIPDDWEVIDFNDCFELLPNNTFSRSELNYNFGDFKNIHYGDILIKFPAILDCSTMEIPFINTNHMIKNNRALVKDGDIIFADTAEDETVGKAIEIFNVGSQKLVSGLHTIPCRPKVIFEPKWLGYYLNHSIYHDQLLPYITGTKVSAISKTSIKETKVVKPLPAEQKAIAEALSDTDNLILSLEKLIDKKKKIKQGAMQQLLTGKKRLPGLSGEGKVSEYGVVPEKWNVKILGEIIEVYRGGSPRPIQEYITTSNNGVNWIKIGDVDLGAKYIDSTEEKIKPEGIARSRFVKSGDVLLSNSMSFGRPYILRTEGCIHDGWLVLKNFEKIIIPDFLYYLLSSHAILNQYKSKAAGSGVLNLNKDLVSSVNLLIPPLEEQKAIAQVLSDMDAEIKALEEKLEKYKTIKQGMMQELLTGRIRLI